MIQNAVEIENHGNLSRASTVHRDENSTQNDRKVSVTIFTKRIRNIANLKL